MPWVEGGEESSSDLMVRDALYWIHGFGSVFDPETPEGSMRKSRFLESLS